MIKINTHQKYQIQNNIIYYKNTIYQGGYDNKNKNIINNGIFYLQEIQSLIVSLNIFKNQFNGPSLFVYDTQNYQYGQWRQHQPHGVSLFRIKDVVVIIFYQNGQIKQGTKILVLMQSYNIGVIAELCFGDNWKIRQKNEIFCISQIQKLIQKCHFHRNVFLSPLKFLNSHFNLQQNHLKIKFVNNQYRFGFDQGIALIMDQNEKFIAIEVPQQLKRSKYSQSPIKAGQVYRQKYLKQKRLTSKDQFFIDPSIKYFEKIKNIINEQLTKSIISGFIKRNNINLSKSRNQKPNNLQIILINQKKQQNYFYQQKLQQNIQNNSLNNISYHQNINLNQSSSIKQKYFYNYLYSHQNTIDYIQIQKTKIRFDKNLYTPQKQNLFQQQKQQPKTQNKQIQQIQIQKKKQQIIQIKKQPKKSKIKIFTKSPTKINSYNLSPQSNQYKFKKSRLRIFTAPRQVSIESSIGKINAFTAEIARISQFNKQQSDCPSSPILALKSLKTQKSKPQIRLENENIQQFTLDPYVSSVSPFNFKPNNKKSLTEYSQKSSAIISEDMSNLRNSNHTKKLISEPHPQKVKRKNEVYKDIQQQIPKVNIYGNMPYLDKQLNKQSSKKYLIHPSITPKNQLIQKMYNF